MEARKIEYYTIEDIYNLPEGVRAELIEGKLYYMATPALRHQRLLMTLSAEIYNYIKAKKGPCEVLPSAFAVFLFNDDETYLEPDITVVCDPAKLDEKGCHGAPDLVIEIISPSSASHDSIRKYALYKEAGVREFWLVDPQNNIVTVCNFTGKDYEPTRYGFADPIPVGIFEDLAIDLSEFSQNIA
ncbi:MAG: Uma2 family endonuclease [Lachnospiraceae bacterium]|jgi:Uma2 family endonuclease|nr:Uma2 family endonuclease [Lachnospiraceae bacterium]